MAGTDLLSMLLGGMGNSSNGFGNLADNTRTWSGNTDTTQLLKMLMGGQQPGGPLSAMAQFLPATMYGMKGVNLSNQNATLGHMGNLADAMTNQNNPLYQQLYGQQKQNNQAALAGTIAEAQRQNRMNSQMGRAPMFAKGRSGEEAFRQMALGAQDADLNASNQARGILNSSMGGLNNIYNSQNQMSQMQLANQQSKVGGMSSLGKLLGYFHL